MEEESEFSQISPCYLHSPGASFLIGCLMGLCWICLVNKSDPNSNEEHKVAEASTMEVKGHAAESQISHENLRSENSTNLP